MEETTNLIKQFEDHLLNLGKLRHTCESYSRDARAFLAFCQKYSLPIHQCEMSTLQHYQGYLRAQESQKHNSIRRGVIGIRQFFRFLEQSGNISSSPFDENPIPERCDVDPKKLSSGDIEALLLHVGSSQAHPVKVCRDGLIIALLGFEGIKASELIQLQWIDYLSHQEFSTLRIQGTKARLIQVSRETHLLIKEYKKMAESYDVLKRFPKAKLLVSFRGRNEDTIYPMLSRHGLKFLLYELGQTIEQPKLNSEMLRHFSMDYLLKQGRSQEEVMVHLGLRQIGNIAKHVLF